MSTPVFSRRIYQINGVMVGPSGANASGAHFSLGNSGTNLLQQISRVTTTRDGFQANRTNITQFGQLAPIARLVTQSPTVNLSYSYYATDGSAEKMVGLNISGSGHGSALQHIIDRTQAEKNFFIPTVAEGTDLATLSGNSVVDVRGFGNAALSSYSVSAAVGGFMTASTTWEALNATYDVGGTGNAIPAVDHNTSAQITGYTYNIPLATSGTVDQPIAIRQGDLFVDLSQVSTTLGATVTGVGAANIQSFTINAPISLEVLQRLGSKQAYARNINFPINVTFSIDALVNQLNNGSVTSLFCDNSTYNLQVSATLPKCDSTTGNSILIYTLVGAQLDSAEFSESVGPAQTVTMQFSAPIGGSSDTLHGFYISGVNP